MPKKGEKKNARWFSARGWGIIESGVLKKRKCESGSVQIRAVGNGYQPWAWVMRKYTVSPKVSFACPVLTNNVCPITETVAV